MVALHILRTKMSLMSVHNLHNSPGQIFNWNFFHKILSCFKNKLSLLTNQFVFLDCYKIVSNIMLKNIDLIKNIKLFKHAENILLKQILLNYRNIIHNFLLFHAWGKGSISQLVLSRRCNVTPMFCLPNVCTVHTTTRFYMMLAAHTVRPDALFWLPIAGRSHPLGTLDRSENSMSARGHSL